MITDEEKNIIKRCAEKYQVKEIFLFGSSLGNPDEAKDIDLAVNGIESTSFFSFYGDLIWGLPKPVDLVDLAYPNKFTQLILREAVKIYG